MESLRLYLAHFVGRKKRNIELFQLMSWQIWCNLQLIMPICSDFLFVFWLKIAPFKVYLKFIEFSNFNY